MKNAFGLTSSTRLNPKSQENFIQQLAMAISGMKKGGQLGGGLNRRASVPFLPGIPEARMDSAISAMLNAGPIGFKRLAYSLQVPLKIKLDYISVDRKILLVDEMPQGDFPIYDLDIPEFGAVKLSALGSPVTFETKIKRTQFPTFVIGIDEPVKYEDQNVRRYPVFDRAKERVAIALAIAEDDECMRILAAAAAVTPNAPLTGSALGKNLLADAVGRITRNQLIAATVLMNPTEYADLLKFNATDLDQVSLNAVVETGYFGGIFGMQLIVSTRCPAGRVYVLTTKDKLGRLPERKKVEVKIFDNVPQGQYDIYGWEQIGMGIHNVAGLQEIIISR